MVGCSLHSPISSKERLPESALLTWAVVEALHDVPSTPEAQRGYEVARSALSDLLEAVCHARLEVGRLFDPAVEQTARQVVVGLTAKRKHGQPWSERDLDRLSRLAGSISAQRISIRLGRTEQSIRAKASAEGISLRTGSCIDSDISLFEEGLQ